MKKQIVRYGVVLMFFILATILSGCGGALPAEAKETVLSAFEDGELPNIHSAKQVEPLPEDLAVGATEVWCVNLTFECWSCDRGEFQTCADSRLVRRIDSEWQVSIVFTDEDQELWKARGCEPIEGKVGG